ncbi:MAG: EamA family transporter [Acidobacteriota bacterium]
MLYLISASLIWSFSFGLIKGNLTSLHPNLVSFIRIAISLLVFLPFIKVKGISTRFKLRLVLIGAVQYGLMYITYIYSYKFLKSYEVALFTIFTPLYVSAIYDMLKKKYHLRYLIISILAVAGTAVVVYKEIASSNFIPGFILLQFSNLFFAWGQVKYRETMKKRDDISDKNIFAYLYSGAFLVTLFSLLITVDINTVSISIEQALTLIYLGSAASGLAFFMWNYGVRRSGIGMISIMNNLKIPLAVIVSMTLFGESGDPVRIILGCIILISALIYNEISEKKERSVSPGATGK